VKRTTQAMFATALVAGGMVLGALQASAAPDGTRVTGAHNGATATSTDGREDGRGTDGKEQSIGDGQNW
jgi:hypothetical protein